MVTPDLFALNPAPMLPLDFPQDELEGRIRRIRSPRYVAYEAGEAILGRLAWLYDHPKVVRPPCSLIYSDTNNGKTALAQKFVRDHSPAEDSPDFGKRPVVYALRLFEIDNNADDFPAYVDLNRVFRRGETTTFCMAALEAEGPLDTRELTARLMRRKGLDEHDKVLSQAVALRIVQTLRSRSRRGLVDGTTRRKGVYVWHITKQT